MYETFSILHSSSWFLLILFFLISYFASGQKVTLMLQRLLALVMIISGIGLLVSLSFPAHYIVKGILAILLIGIMEMLVVRKKKQKGTGFFWVLWIILVALVLSMGFGG
ncbi:DUF1516 family protein [Bacillus piscicola]|uniref:DUF1516 family protein n=1 Tax=Bacillus piscicola TaxID=1632684 RepID=UPI001F09ECE0|nr:DUF1516 family protein [Bacillus piscicola]